jgi:hypothetical protein
LDGELSAVLKLAVHMAASEGGLRHQIYVVRVISMTPLSSSLARFPVC